MHVGISTCSSNAVFSFANNIMTTQMLVLLNWDDPYSLFMAGNMHARKHGEVGLHVFIILFRLWGCNALHGTV